MGGLAAGGGEVKEVQEIEEIKESEESAAHFRPGETLEGEFNTEYAE